MNPFQAIYCRAFQTALYLSLPLLPYRTPETVPSVDALPQILEREGCRRVILITDRQVYELGLTRALEQALTAQGIFYTVFADTVANPTTETVAQALEQYRREDCDGIIGLGGGSSMDCAKAVGARVAKPRQSLARMKGILKVRKKLPPLVAIPTTAGTGSETTLAAVIVDAETRHKYAINDFPLIPRYAVLDPALTLSLPPFVTATTGMDALTHAVEAYIGRSTTRETRAYALEAVQLIFANLDRAYADGSDREARANMLRAAFCAGCAFTKSYVGYVHAVAHSLGGAYNVPHGLANAVLLPFVLEGYGAAVEPKLHQLAVAAGLAQESIPVHEGAALFIQAVKDMKRRFGIGDTIPALRREDIPRLAVYAHREANPLYPVPVLMNARELERFYYAVLEE